MNENQEDLAISLMYEEIIALQTVFLDAENKQLADDVMLNAKSLSRKKRQRIVDDIAGLTNIRNDLSKALSSLLFNPGRSVRFLAIHNDGKIYAREGNKLLMSAKTGNGKKDCQLIGIAAASEKFKYFRRFAKDLVFWIESVIEAEADTKTALDAIESRLKNAQKNMSRKTFKTLQLAIGEHLRFAVKKQDLVLLSPASLKCVRLARYFEKWQLAQIFKNQPINTVDYGELTIEVGASPLVSDETGLQVGDDSGWYFVGFENQRILSTPRFYGLRFYRLLNKRDFRSMSLIDFFDSEQVYVGSLESASIRQLRFDCNEFLAEIPFGQIDLSQVKTVVN